MISIRYKLIILFAAVLLVILVFLFLANSFFLEDYYIFRNKHLFLEACDLIRGNIPKSQEELLLLTQELSKDIGLKVMIVTGQGRIKFSSSPEFTKSKSLVLPKEQIDFLQQEKKSLKNGQIFYGALEADYQRSSIVQLIGKLDEKDFLVVSSPLNPIRENARIAVDFILIISLIILCLGVPIILLLSLYMIKSITKIKNIALSIAHLDFSKKYCGSSNDEIGQLGKSINRIAEELDHALMDLKKKNEQLTREMGRQKRFFAGVSHDFKTPVGLIRGYAESLQLGLVKNGADQEEMLRLIVSETGRLNQLVSDIVFMVKTDSTSLSLEKEDFCLTELCTAANNHFLKQMNDKKINIIITIPADLHVKADRKRLLRVFDNLLENAIRHTPMGGQISVYGLVNNESDRARIEIINSGPLIKREHLPHLFDPFFRADEARSREQGGAGLGLAIVAAIVKAHGGEWGVENRDEGPGFWFTLPL